MEVALLVKSIMGLVVVLAFLMVVFFLPSVKKLKKEKVVAKKVAQQKKIATDLESLRAIIKKKVTTAKELKNALDLVLKYHGVIHKKLGLRSHPDFDIYMEILFTICRHPNTDKNIIINFDKELSRLNPEYKKEINEAITKGLNSRRV